MASNDSASAASRALKASAPLAEVSPYLLLMAWHIFLVGWCERHGNGGRVQSKFNGGGRGVIDKIAIIAVGNSYSTRTFTRLLSFGAQVCKTCGVAKPQTV